MKLDDIDILVTRRAEFKRRWNQFVATKNSTPEGVNIGNSRVDDWDIMVKVGVLLRDEIETKLNEAKATMMALGVTEFPE